MRKLASVCKIAASEPVPDSDRLSVVRLQDKCWRVVTGRDEFKPGELCVYFEIDSALPADDGRYAFLRERCLRKFVTKSGALLKECIRIRTAKLRGVVSQGLVMPLDKFPEVTDCVVFNYRTGADEFLRPGSDEPGPLCGADVTELLNVEHFDEVNARYSPAGASVSGEKMGDFPTHLFPKTDEERIQNLADWFGKMKGRKWECTVKADGTSVSMAYAPKADAENPFFVCTRNMRLKPADAAGKSPMPWLIAEKQGVEAKLKGRYGRTGRQIALQGELVGPGIQCNRDGQTEHEWKVFYVYDVDAGKYVLPDEARAIVAELGLRYVEVLDEAKDVFSDCPEFDDLMAYADGMTANGNRREGVVFKTVDEPFLHFKCVSNKYLLSEK